MSSTLLSGVTSGAYLLMGCQAVSDAWLSPSNQTPQLLTQKAAASAFLGASLLGVAHWMSGARAVGIASNLLYIPYYSEECAQGYAHLKEPGLRPWIQVTAAVAWVAYTFFDLALGADCRLAGLMATVVLGATALSIFDNGLNWLDNTVPNNFLSSL